MKIATLKNKTRVNEVVNVHMQSFTGFFLTFLGKGFLRQLYKGFVEHENSGLLVAVGDDEDLARRILEILSDRSLYESMSKKAMAWTREMFTAELMAAKMEKLYAEARK